MSYQHHLYYKCQFDLDETWRDELYKEAKLHDYQYYVRNIDTENWHLPIRGHQEKTRQPESGRIYSKSSGDRPPHWSWPQTWLTPEKHKTKIIEKMINLINPSLKLHNVLYMYFQKGASTPIHLDENEHRRTVIAWALSPLETFSPITFYTTYREIIETVYYTSKPLMFNPLNYHSVGLEVKNNYDRYSFQLCYNEPIGKLIELEQQGKLFVTGEDHFQIAIAEL
jgi:hypothetical protein